MNGFKHLTTVAIIALVGATGQAALMEFQTSLSGPEEFPPNASPGTGFADVIYDSALHTLQLDISFSGLLGTVSVAHIHAPTAVPGAGGASVATTTPTFAGFPIGVTAGAYFHTLDLTLASSFNPSFVTANGSVAASETALINAMVAGEAYLNIHSTAFPGGEIRGFLNQVPEIATVAPWFLLVVSGLYGFERRRRGHREF